MISLLYGVEGRSSDNDENSKMSLQIKRNAWFITSNKDKFPQMRSSSSGFVEKGFIGSDTIKKHINEMLPFQDRCKTPNTLPCKHHIKSIDLRPVSSPYKTLQTYKKGNIESHNTYPFDTMIFNHNQVRPSNYTKYKPDFLNMNNISLETFRKTLKHSDEFLDNYGVNLMKIYEGNMNNNSSMPFNINNTWWNNSAISDDIFSRLMQRHIVVNISR